MCIIIQSERHQPKPKKKDPSCSFCRKPKKQVKNLISNNLTGSALKHICDECIAAFKLITEKPEPEIA